MSWTQLVLAGWGAGSLAILLITTTRVIRFGHMLRRGGPAQPVLLKEIELLAARIGLVRPPRVVIVDESVSPMLWFIGGSPRLVLPRGLLDRMGAHQRAGVIAHELAHLRRGDHWVRLLEFPATVALWWHPLVWVARRGLREAEEQCCDAWAVSLVPDGRRCYADALVDAIELIGRPWRLPLGATGLGQLGILQRRLTMIVTQSPPKSVSFAGRGLVIVLLGAVAIAPVRGEPPAAPGSNVERPAATTTAVDDTTRQAVLALLQAAQDRDQNVSQSANRALVQFGPSAVPALIDSLKDPTTAQLSIVLLAQLGPVAVDGLVNALESRDPVVREYALQALDHMVLPGQTGLGEMMDPAMMEGAAMGVPGGFGMQTEGMIGMEMGEGRHQLATRLIGPVSKAAEDSEATVRRAAVQLLFKLATATQDQALVPPLLAALKDENTQVRMYAAYGLGRLGPMASGAVDALAAAVGEKDLSLRLSALDALASMGPNAKGAMGAVVAAMKSPEPQVRAAAARALGSMHAPPPAAALPGGFEFIDAAIAPGPPAAPSATTPVPAQ